MKTRADSEQFEREHLAPYAAKAADSRGRAYPAPEHPLRTAFQRDRDRVIHSAAFRRMEYKTQVFIPHEGDHFRTRLTHTLEVSQISRTMTRALGLNEDLSEAIALVHDLGHTPFGHAGEDVLNVLLASAGGFNHNRQSLRVVDLIEQRYPEHPGLNLSFEVREGIAKHETKGAIVGEEFSPHLLPTLEASLVDMADEIAYNAHDIDDGIRAGLITLDSLRPLSIWNESDAELFTAHGVLGNLAEDQKRHLLVRRLVDRVVTDVVAFSEANLRRWDISCLDDVRKTKERICAYSPSMTPKITELKGFLRQNMYRHPQLTALTERAKLIITGLYNRIGANHELLPPRYREMLLTERPEIVVADYIAGMTDRYAERLWEQGGE
ncbi:MAG: deoxyguanosinetriphosphate triphosphohydrolase [candidate division Zixibacteria bacterium]|nr:deoxyguanosinetriphosphate triphosphohydrolase [candidate division Zixibacteria bacterium]